MKYIIIFLFLTGCNFSCKVDAGYICKTDGGYCKIPKNMK